MTTITQSKMEIAALLPKVPQLTGAANFLDWNVAICDHLNFYELDDFLANDSTPEDLRGAELANWMDLRSAAYIIMNSTISHDVRKGLREKMGWQDWYRMPRETYDAICAIYDPQS
jgi:hypothetical protein